MTPERESEKFQPRMVASFSRRQLESVGVWLRSEYLDRKALNHGITFDSALETAEHDEKGRIMDAKSRKRLTYGLATINTLHKEGVRLDQIIGTIQVWQVAPDEDKIKILFDKIKPTRNSGQRRY